MNFNNTVKWQPVDIPFNWMAEYYDGSYVTEYDLSNLSRNSFYTICKEKLSRFGLFGADLNFYFECYGGTFNLNGHRLDIEYHEGDDIYYLTGHSKMCQDIITYKEAACDIDTSSQDSETTLLSINFGYKQQIIENKKEFSFQPIVCLPSGENAFLQVKLTCNEDINGKLVFKRGGRILDTIDAPLQKGYSGQINWTMK